ncbi:MAG: T9SS type A sorting domain-containing protein [candidate division Zixibacteria bacterium]|nr:T9SS type A sorting domain-containing protein [candidate division Zixibacteria bacterium]
MLKRISLVAVLLLFLTGASWATNKLVATQELGRVSLALSADEPLGGVAVALKFAEPGTDIICSRADFSNGIADYIADDGQSGVKFTQIDNEKKTILAVVIPFTAEALPKGEGVFLNLEFKGTGTVKLEETTVYHQKGISLVNIQAQEIPYEFNPIELVNKVEQVIPKEFSLAQNYPNPFNPITTVSYALPVDAPVKLTIYNILGQRVKTLVDDYQTAGYKQVIWDGTNENGQEVSSGIYFYQIKAGSFSKTAKMSMLK